MESILKQETLSSVVRIQIRVSKRQYLRAKRTYEYERMSLDIPRKFHETLKPLIRQDFNIDVKLEKDSVIITLTPAKTFRHAENTLGKTLSETNQSTPWQHQAKNSV